MAGGRRDGPFKGALGPRVLQRGVGHGQLVEHTRVARRYSRRLLDFRDPFRGPAGRPQRGREDEVTLRILRVELQRAPRLAERLGRLLVLKIGPGESPPRLRPVRKGSHEPHEQVLRGQRLSHIQQGLGERERDRTVLGILAECLFVEPARRNEVPLPAGLAGAGGQIVRARLRRHSGPRNCRENERGEEQDRRHRIILPDQGGPAPRSSGTGRASRPGLPGRCPTARRS